MIYINELLKLYYKRINIIVIFLIVIIIFALAFGQKEKEEDSNWKDKLKKENITYETQLKKSDGEMKKVLSEKIYKNSVYIKENINPNTYNQFNFMNKTLPIFLIVSLYSLIISSSTINDEYRFNTIKNIQSSPQSPIKVIVNKYLACISISGLLLLVLFFITYFVGGITNEFAPWNTKTVYFRPKPYLEPYINHIFKVYIGNYLFLCLIISINMLLASIIRIQSLTLIIGMLIMLFHVQIAQKIPNFKYDDFFVIQQLDIKNKILLWSSHQEYYSMVIAFIIILIYIFIFLILSSLFFNKKAI